MLTRSRKRKEQAESSCETSSSDGLQRKKPHNLNQRGTPDSQVSDDNCHQNDSDNGKMVTEQTWVQCELESCLKWRRISSEEAKQLSQSKQWFCTLNWDTEHNRCENPEEICDEFGVRKYGYRYVYSQLPVGSLVWAKMPGHVSWPAILCPSPEDNTYVSYDEDGDVLWYHVEFLGKVHSHCWVLYYNVEVYARGKQPINILCHPVQKQKSNRLSKPVMAKKYRSKAYNEALQAAIEEADSLALSSCPDHLEQCVYRYQEHCTENKNSEPSVEASPSGPQEKKMESQQTVQKPKKKQKTTHHISKEDQIKSKEELSDAGKLSSSNEWIPSLSSLANCSKEEKFTSDVQAWQEKATAFEETVLNFMKTRSMPIKRLPFWQGVHINLYQLYMAVQDGGGFHRVCMSPGGWATVYRQSTGIDKSRSSGAQTAKIYYQRNLLPYELYRAGKNYDIVTPEVSKSNLEIEFHHSLGAEKKPPHIDDVNTDYSRAPSQCSQFRDAKMQELPVSSNSPEDFADEAAEAMREMEDIENMLTNLKTDVQARHDEPCNQFDRVVERVTTAPKSTPEAMKLKFYSGYLSDSSQVEDSQNSNLQCVPDVTSQVKYTTQSASDYFLEMEKTELEIDQLYDEISHQWTVL
ncbi:uncharacterized protein [Ptychodera flava]|uniref:uncharacterized protein isoform X2 n=1 Tax=Ptychodera flava TaxID=63121 RepID=UPI00396A771A